MNLSWTAILCVVAFSLTLGWVAATPSTDIPVGVATTDGISMGHEGNGLVLYANLGDPEIGDPVVYHSEASDQYIRHRVVDETDSGYITKGDALTATDYEYRGDVVRPEENYVGKQIIHIPIPQLNHGGRVALDSLE